MTATLSAYQHFAGQIDRALEIGEKPLLESQERSLTYAQLGSQMLRANALFATLGLKPGDRAALFSQDARVMVTLFFAMLRAGITPVLGDAGASQEEIAALLKIADVSALFADDRLLDHGGNDIAVTKSNIISIGPSGNYDQMMAAAVPRVFANPAQEPEVAVIVFTSGTTAEPKGVMLTYANLIGQLQIFAEVYGFDGDTRLLNSLPLHHVDGMVRGPLAALWFHGTVVRFENAGPAAIAQALRSAASSGITHFVAVPAILSIILRLRLDESHKDAFKGPAFRFVICSADHLDLRLWQQFEHAFGVTVVNADGLSEVVCDALFCGPAADRYQRGTLSKPAGCEARVLLADNSEAMPGESGELCLRGPTVMAGYFNAPAATGAVMKDGWFHTGDYVEHGADGYFRFVGRKKSRIVSAGVTIHPEAISTVLATMSGVEEVVTFGVDDPVRGQKVVACIVAAAEATLDTAMVHSFAASHLGPERVPSAFHLLRDLPRNAAGKVDLEALASVVSALPDANAGGGKATVYDLAA